MWFAIIKASLAPKLSFSFSAALALSSACIREEQLGVMRLLWAEGTGGRNQKSIADSRFKMETVICRQQSVYE
jgi:hypothetical protein